MKKFQKKTYSFFLIILLLFLSSCWGGDIKVYKDLPEKNIKDSLKIKKLKIQTH
jgi:hypothetical protein|tara:strand:+ start:1455 stop:1616 length:162 start_codon:yes stop_codon:yes gene_type:complete